SGLVAQRLSDDEETALSMAIALGAAALAVAGAAFKLKIGKFEAAHRGTIFLDEIGDLHPALQAKLLHVLQDGEFSRIGAKSTLSVDVRVLAATNQDLERAVAEGRFREDLYYRLNVVQVFVPPLRERTSEIPLLANYFVERYAKLYRRDGFAISPAV